MSLASRAYTLNQNDNQVQYGVKAVRQLRQVRKCDLIARNPSSRQNHRQAIVFEYFRQKVDPIIQSCITFLLCAQPHNISNVMYDFMLNWKNEKKNNYVLPETTTKTTKAQRLYLATQVSPIITRIVAELSRHRPDDVITFICDELKKIINEEEKEIKGNGELSASTQCGPSNMVGNSGTADSGSNKGSITTSSNVHHYQRPSTTDGSLSPRSNNNNVSKVNNNNNDDIKLARPESAPSIGINAVNSGNKKEVQEIQIALLGIGNSGKTSFLNTIQGRDNVKVKPTMGFRPVTMMLGDELKLRFYDLGGGKKIRDIWEQYYHDIHGFIYLFDCSGTPDECKESIEVYNRISEHEFLKDKPALILANKQDIPGSINGDVLNSLLNISNKKCTTIKECYCYSSVEPNQNENAPDVFQVADPRIETSLLWLLDNIRMQFQDINQRVVHDTTKKEIDENKKRLLKERNVLRNKIAVAFMDQIDKNIPDLNLCANPNDLFGPIDGPKFLAGEIGVDIRDLDPIALEVSFLVGNQRLALQMVGGLNVPVNKKKVPMSWSAIKDLVVELRLELGLSPNVEIQQQ